MAVFSDTFAGSGSIVGHTPETGFGGLTWQYLSGSTLGLSGGSAVKTSGAITSTGYATYGAVGGSYGLVGAINISFSITTGSTVNDSASAGRGLALEFNISGSVYGIYLDLDGGGGGWSLGDQVNGVAVSMAPNTTYSGTFSITNATQTLTFLGQTLTTNYGFLDALGLQRIKLGVGSTLVVNSLGALDPAAGAVGSINLIAPMATASIFGGGTAKITAPSPTLAATATSEAGTWVFTGVCPAQTLSATGKDASGINAATLIPTRPVLSAFSGASSKLAAPSQTLSITGTFSGSGHAALTAPAQTLSATGKVSSVADAALTAPMAKMVGYFGSVATVSITGKATLTATVTTGGVAYATLTAPLFELTATATAQRHGSAILTAPVGRLATTGAAWLIAPGAQLTAIGTAVVAVSYEAYALNLNHRNPDSPDELTRYTNYPFDRIVRYENSYFGMNATGLYLLEGTTDFAEPTPTKVPWRFKTGLTDFDSPNLKTVNWAYFGGRMAPAATISIHYGDSGEQNYAYSTPRGSEAQNYRQPFGRGIKSRYYAVEAEGSGALSIDSMMFDIASMARKV